MLILIDLIYVYVYFVANKMLVPLEDGQLIPLIIKLLKPKYACMYVCK